MTELQVSEFTKLKEQLEWQSQRIYELEKVNERLRFEKEANEDELNNKVRTSSLAYGQVLDKFQLCQAQLKKVSYRVTILEAENEHILEQLRYMQASEEEQRTAALFYQEQAQALEFNLHYKNHVLSNHESLYNQVTDLRADNDFFNTLSRLDAAEQTDLLHAIQSLVTNPSDTQMDIDVPMSSSTSESAPSRPQKDVKPLRETSKLARLAPKDRPRRKFNPNKTAPPRRK